MSAVEKIDLILAEMLADLERVAMNRNTEMNYEVWERI